MPRLSPRLAALALLAAPTLPTLAQPANPVTTTVRERIFADQPGRGEAGGWALTLSPSAEVNLPTSYDDADLTVSRAGSDLSAEYWFSQQLIATFGVGGEYSYYALSNVDEAAGVDEPISHALRTSVRPGVRVNFSREWGAFAFGVFELAGDPGADIDKSFTGGGAGGVRWSPNDALTLLLGGGAASRLDDSTSYYPILGVNWRIDERWSFDTLGTGGAIRYRLDPAWRFGLGARYESRDFRLDDDASVPDGVLRDDRVDVELTATWTPQPAVDVTAAVGAVPWSRITIDSAGSDEVFEATGDLTGFLSLRGVIRF
jgi:hypothetical protein